MNQDLLEDIFQNELIRLFKEAQNRDEFEYICALLNFNGMGEIRASTHLYESQDLLFQITERIQEAKHRHEAIRYFLLLYCHIFEMDEFYNIIGNMLRIVIGERFCSMLYNSPTIKQELKPSNKIDKLKSLANQTGYTLLIDTISELYSSALRNSFFHSSYSLSGDDYYIVSGKKFKIDGVITPRASIKDYILPITQSTINMGGYFFNTFNEAKQEYKENKIVTGRLQPGGIKIEILGDAKLGLRGFKTIIE